jgi:hypothetical protein
VVASGSGEDLEELDLLTFQPGTTRRGRHGRALRDSGTPRGDAAGRLEAHHIGPSKNDATEPTLDLVRLLLDLVQHEVHVLVTAEQSTGENAAVLQLQDDPLLEHPLEKRMRGSVHVPTDPGDFLKPFLRRADYRPDDDRGGRGP